MWEIKILLEVDEKFKGYFLLSEILQEYSESYMKI